MSLQPLVDAMHVKMMATLTLDRSTVLSRILALGARHFERVHTDDTVRVGDIPVPSCDSEPLIDSDFHFLL